MLNTHSPPRTGMFCGKSDMMFDLDARDATARPEVLGFGADSAADHVLRTAS